VVGGDMELLRGRVPKASGQGQTPEHVVGKVGHLTSHLISFNFQECQYCIVLYLYLYKTIHMVLLLGLDYRFVPRGS